MSIDSAVAAFRKHPTSRDVSERHTQEVTQRIRKAMDGCAISTVAGIRADDIQCFLASLRGNRFGKATANHYVRAVRQFGRWLVRSRILCVDPTRDLRMLNDKTDQRHARRALTPEEFYRLVAAADASQQEIEPMSGYDRSMMYQLRVGQGSGKVKSGA